MDSNDVAAGTTWDLRRLTQRVGATAAAGAVIGGFVLAGPGAAAATGTTQSLCGEVAPAPPAVVGQGTDPSDTLIRLYNEQTDFALPQALDVDITPPGSYPETVDNIDQLTETSIPAGTEVDSYFAISDPTETAAMPTHNYPFQASYSFTTPILGVIVTDGTDNPQGINNLFASDSIVGAPGTKYEEQTDRGLELGGNPGSLTVDGDSVTLDNPYKISLNFLTSTDTDQIRIITAATSANGSTGACPVPTSPGGGSIAPQYTEVASDGGIFTFDSPFYGSTGDLVLNKPMVGGSEDPLTGGYWEVASDGGIFSFNAPFYGSLGGTALNAPVVSVTANPDGLGYRMFAADGGVFDYGDSVYWGSEGGTKLNEPVVGGASLPDSTGYWMVASDGGVFSFGPAQFYGSTGDLRLNQPIVGMAPTPDGGGYWLVAKDGGIFSFGDAQFYGSTGNLRLNAPVVGMKATPDGRGYWLFAADGGVFSFGDAQFLGSEGGVHLNKPVVGDF